ncbi:MAG: hypothetical protein JWQ18_24 [Conexibacter sp.]|nr:hypothetical protein [Conexibacter sp.]
MSVTERLVASTMMNDEIKLSINILSDTFDKQAPPDDATAGFFAWFRQIHKPNEEASFDCVMNLLSNRAHESGADHAADILSTWKRAHKLLQAKHQRALMQDILRQRGIDGGESDGRRISSPVAITPRELLDTYLYGDTLHWGKPRGRLAEMQTTALEAAKWEFEMLQDASMLAHFYVGFADIARVALAADPA